MVIMPPVKSGISELDELTGGFFPGELTIVGARDVRSETAFIFSVIKNSILNHTAKPILFSLSWSTFFIKQSLDSIISGVSARKLYNDCVKDLDVKNRAEEIISSSDFVFGYFKHIKIDELCNKIRQFVYENEQNQTIIFIEYYYYISTDDDKSPCYKRMTEIIMKLKALAQELSVPIVCTFPLGFQIDNTEPDLELLRKRDGLLVEENADAVILIHGKKNQKNDNGIFSRELIVAKNKSGKTGRCTFSIPCF